MIENWTETTYIFPLDDKGNYLPIYVFDCDITSKELEETYASEKPRLIGETSNLMNNSYFACNNNLITYYNTIYVGLKTESKRAYLGAFKKVENEFFTITQLTPDNSGHFILKNNGKEIADFGYDTWGNSQEWFDGGRNGLNPQYRFTMFQFDYTGEKIIEYNGKQYTIYRTYNRSVDEIELYAELRKGNE